MSTSSDDFFGDRIDEYEDFIRGMVPFYSGGNELLVDMVPFPLEQALRVLDVGTGTGALSRVILNHFPNALVLATDVSERVLEEAAANLARFGDRIAFREAAFPDGDFGTGYDLIVSGLAIHHVDDDAKANGFRRLLNALNPCGVLLVRDFVKGATTALDRRYDMLWRRSIDAHGGIDMSSFEEHIRNDQPSRVEDQLRWLVEAGFVDVGCHWRHLNFAIFGGCRPAA